MLIDTGSAHARAQYDANVAFALDYEPLRARRRNRPRVLVTGFGRFLDNNDNASGRIVSALVPGAAYPKTARPVATPRGWAVDPPEAQTSVAIGTVDLPKTGTVDVCAMIVPVHWDLAAILIAKQIDAFEPSLVLMNGIAGASQDLWIELGSVNLAMALEDGSNILHPVVEAGQTHAKIFSRAAAKDRQRGFLLSWNRVRSAAEKAVNAHANIRAKNERFGDLLPGVRLGAFPRNRNTYVCNNTAYVINFLMDHPGRAVTLLKASTGVKRKPNSVRVLLEHDARTVPRAFVHWPSKLVGHSKLTRAGADILKAMIDAQLTATKHGEVMAVGDNASANAIIEG